MVEIYSRNKKEKWGLLLCPKRDYMLEGFVHFSILNYCQYLQIICGFQKKDRQWPGNQQIRDNKSSVRCWSAVKLTDNKTNLFFLFLSLFSISVWVACGARTAEVSQQLKYSFLWAGNCLQSTLNGLSLWNEFLGTLRNTSVKRQTAINPAGKHHWYDGNPFVIPHYVYIHMCMKYIWHIYVYVNTRGCLCDQFHSIKNRDESYLDWCFCLLILRPKYLLPFLAVREFS